MLEDETTYRKLKKDPTTTAENTMNAMLLGLKNKGILAEGLYRQLRSSGEQIPLFYGLPKIHKTRTPLRPIASFISSPTYALSKFLSKVLSPLMGKTESHVSSSTEFVTFCKTITIPQGYTLLSFDVVSLFTNVPTDLPVEVVKRRLKTCDVVDEVGIPAGVIISFLQFCLSSTYFKYKEEFYEQIHGTAMGSSVSVVVANIAMEEVERQASISHQFTASFGRDMWMTSCVQSLVI